MEKAVLKTIIYADLFDYPLKAWEIHKWLIGKQASLQQVERALTKLTKSKKIGTYKDFYFLPQKRSSIKKRIEKMPYSTNYFSRAKFFANFLKIIPWISLVGISGNLAMDNAGEEDDIDLVIITQKKRLWITRVAVFLIFSIFDLRRSRGEDKESVAGKFCTNIFLEETSLGQESHDLFTAHEVLQMRVLWQRGKTYQSFLEDNAWALEYLPNWKAKKTFSNTDKRQKPLELVDSINNILKNIQLRYMGIPTGDERINEGAVYFLPNDLRGKILQTFNKKLKNVK